VQFKRNSCFTELENIARSENVFHFRKSSNCGVTETVTFVRLTDWTIQQITGQNNSGTSSTLEFSFLQTKKIISSEACFLQLQLGGTAINLPATQVLDKG
jgi:hypothetical protein